MARNGSGTYVRVHDWQADAAAGIKIRADRMDAEDDSIATALTESIARDGQTTITADLPMAGFNHTGVGAGSARGEYARVDELQDNDHIFGGTAGGTADALTASCSPAITAYVRGMTVGVEVASANTGAATLNVDSVGASTIKKNGNQDLAANDLVAGMIAWFSYEDTSDVWHILNPVSQNDVITTRGDIVRGDSSGDAERLALGSSGTLLRSDGTDAGWSAIQDSDIALTTQGDILYRDASGLARLAAGTSGYALKTQGSGANPVWGPTVTSETFQSTGSGTAVDFTGLPAGLKRITIMFNEVSLSGTDKYLIQIGDSGGIETTGYVSTSGFVVDAGATVASSSTSGFVIESVSASSLLSGHMTLTLITGTTWIASHVGKIVTDRVVMGGGSKSLSAELDRVRITRSGSDTFDGGNVNIFTE